jgi:hypothetical protein
MRQFKHESPVKHRGGRKMSFYYNICITAFCAPLRVNRVDKVGLAKTTHCEYSYKEL